MAQTGYTPIQLYYSTTATNVPSAGNLANGELAINIADKKLYAKDSTGTVFLLASESGTTGTVSSVAMTVPSFLSVSGSPITTSGTLAVTLSGTALPVANGGTGITSFGSGVATWLGTPSSSNLAAAVTDETGSGSLVFATSPTLVTPILGTPTSGTLSNCTVDGTYSVGFRKIPPVGTKTSSYTIAAADVGKYVEIGSGGSLVVPASTFASGDAVSVFNNTSGNITITCSAVTTYIAGTDSVKTSLTLATRGVANILFNSASVCVVTGNVS